MVTDTEDFRALREKVDAHDRAIAENRHQLANARQVMDIKLDTIDKNVTELKNALKWAGGLIVSLMLSFMAWAALQQFNANEQQKKDLKEQIELLQRSKQAAGERDAILQELKRSSELAVVESNTAR